MDSPRHAEASGDTTDDLSALAWVHEELRRSLDNAHKALRRFVKEAEANAGSDVDAVDPSVLRTARQQLHQGVGALELVGLPAAATVLRACESAVQRYVAKPHKLTAQVVDDIEHASFALIDYLARILAGKRVSALSMFPQYRAVQEAAGADRAHPADLWAVDWRWLDVPAAGAPSLARETDGETRAEMESQMLALMKRGKPATAARMSDLCAGLAAGATASQVVTIWRLAAGVFDAQSAGLLSGDLFLKRVAARLLSQLRILERGETDVSERLAQDLLFFCAQAASPGDGRIAPRLAAVRQAYGLEWHEPVDYSASGLGKYDPAWVAQARKRVSGAKDSWSAVAGGEMHRLGGLAEQFTLVGESLRKLFPTGEAMAGELQQALAVAQQANGAPPAPLAMEVATALLYVEAALEDAEFDNPEQQQRMTELAQRIAGVRRGAAPQPLEPWMEDLYRRVSDRQTMGSVVQELRASLSEAEKLIDQFFRNPTDRQVLIPVPNQLASMRGVLSVLGMDQASAALLRMRDEVDGMIATEVDPERVQQAGLFDRIAANLGALGFLIDMLSVQPHMAKSLFRYDADEGRLNPVMGRSPQRAPALGSHRVAPPPAVEPRLIEQAQMLAFTAVRDDVPVEQVAQALERLVHEAEAADQPMLVAATQQAQQALAEAEGDDAVASVRGQLSEALVDFVHSASDASTLTPPEPTPATAPAPERPIDLPMLKLDEKAPGEDDEMLEIFLEEALEVMGNAREAMAALADAPDDLGQITTVRRAFHTLKGSSRMVGLREFGDASWSCERLYNGWLADQKPADAGLLEVTNWVLGYLGQWIEAISARRTPAQHAAEVDAALQRLLGGDAAAPAAAAPGAMAAPAASTATDASLLPTEPAPLELPSAALAEPMPEVIETIDAIDLSLPEVTDVAEPAEPAASADPSLALPELQLDLPDQPLVTELHEPAVALPVVEAPTARADLPEVSFELDFSRLDEPLAPAAAAVAEPIESVVPEAPVDVSPAPGAIAAAPADSEALSTLADAANAADIDLATLDLIDLETGSDETMPVAQAAEVPALADEAIDLDLDLGDSEAPLAAPTAAEAAAPSAGDAPMTTAAEPPVAEAPAVVAEEEQVKVVGPLRISIPLFNIYLNEADELSRRLTTELAEWAMELERPMPEQAVALAHSLAGSSATVGFADLSHLARQLEHALTRTQSIGHGTPEEGRLYVETAEEIRRLLHQFAAGFLKEPAPALLQRLADHEIEAAQRLEAAAADAERRSASGEADALAEPMPAASSADDADLVLDLPVEPQPQPPTEVAAERPPEPQPIAELAPPPAAAPAETSIEPAPAPAPDPFAPRRHDALSAAGPATTGFGTLDSAFHPLGVAELKTLAPLATPAAERQAPAHAAPIDADDDDIDAVDAVDADLFPIFEEEGQELLPQLHAQLRDWAATPSQTSHAGGCMRTLHTLKGGARLAGAMRLGELAHRLESQIEQLLATESAQAADVEALQARADKLSQTFEALRSRDAQAYAEAVEASNRGELPPPSTPMPTLQDVVEAPAPATPAEPIAASHPHETPAAVPAPSAAPAVEPPAAAAPLVSLSLPEIDWSRFRASSAQVASKPSAERAASQSAVRVRAPLLDRLVNQAGEVSITRSRIESEVAQIRASVGDLTENLERLRQQLRDIELQAETQMSSRMEAAKAASQSFDPLEFDRFTRFQELTRMMAESVNDVATVQRTLQRTLESTEDELAAQARLTRELQDDLLRTRMVEFEGLSDRLYRVVRQAAKETGKQVRLDIVGGSIEVDRGVLDRMTGAFEHLLRNSVTHGVEPPDERARRGKDAVGSIVVALTHEGNEVGVEFRDDGAGLDLARIREKGLAMRLLEAGVEYSDAELANLIFTPGFSTAERVTELAGRGVGMDVVRSEVNAMGGRIETATAAGQGTSFKLVLPLTTAVTQVVMLRVDQATIAVPSTLVEIVRRATLDEVREAYESGSFIAGDRTLPFFWLGSLLQMSGRSAETGGRTRHVVIIRSAAQRIALHVDEVLGNQEVVVKNLGPQLSRMPGLAGMTLLASGAVALIYNPVALATLYGAEARAATLAALHPAAADTQQPAMPVVEEQGVTLAPLVLVVDDSLTVRRVTQRLLVREGYRVTVAKDGLDALERLAEEKPQVVLSDIEMPRMDGFDLVRNIRGDARLRDLPVIMITSRIAQKHRDYAAELGVDHYLGKPYSEEDLLALIGRYTAESVLG